MRLHPLAPEVRCPNCGAGLVFVRVRLPGDLYECASGGPCKCRVLHYRDRTTKTCGYAALYTYGALGVGPFGKWTACAGIPAKGE